MLPLVTVIAVSLGVASSTFATPLDAADYTPIVVPLAVRTPYLGAYLQGRQDKNLATSDPRFWTGTPLGWRGLVRVDGTVWNWMGNLTEYPAAINSSFVHTTARSTFTFTNNPATVALEANFVSPVTPADVFRQSIPFSYLSLTVTSLDGRPHSVQVYTDVNGLWLADKEEEQLEWDHKREPDWNGIRFRLTHQRPFTEEQIEKGWTADRILSGDAWYAAGIDKAIATTFSAGEDATTTRRLFASQGQLDNGSRRISRHASTTTRTRDQANSSAIVDEPVFAFAHDFGAVNAAMPADARTQLLAIGHVRDPLVQYMAQGNRTVDMRPLWRSAFDSTESLVKFFLGDFDHAVRASDAFNAKLYSDARKVDGDEYAHVVSVSTRQISAALEAVWDEEPLNSDTGAKNGRLVAFSPVTGDPIPAMIMLKEVSSNGNCGTVDVLAPFLPFMVYAAPSLVPLLIEPTLRYAATGLYTPVPPPHDIGDHYPACIGHNDFLYPGLPIEEAGNMLNMVLAGMRSSNPRTDPALVTHAMTRAKHWWESAQKRLRLADDASVGWDDIVGRGRDHRREGAKMAREQAIVYYDLLKVWADYLVDESLFPDSQSSTDDFFGPAPNQTSLVIKGITGIRSMSEIAADLGHSDDSAHYRRRADSITDRFLELAIAADGTHLIASYGNQTSWMTHYNLYYDKLLNGFSGDQQFPDFVYSMQDEFYPTVAQPYGPALDSRFPSRAKTDWLLWAAGASEPTSRARRIFVDAVARYFRADKNAVFGDAITPQEGWSVGFLTRPVTGGHYSLLALEVMKQETIRRRGRIAREWFALASVVASVVVGLVAWRTCRRKRFAKGGYQELLMTARTMRRRFSSRGGGGGEEAIWLAETPEQGSVFDLGMSDGGHGDDDDDDDDDEKWAKRRIGRRSSSLG